MGMSECTQQPTDRSEGLMQSVEFDAGSLGIDLEAISGKVMTVKSEGQAERLGVKIGWTMQQVNGVDYTEQLLDSFISGSSPYTVTFKQELPISVLRGRHRLGDVYVSVRSFSQASAEALQRALARRGEETDAVSTEISPYATSYADAVWHEGSSSPDAADLSSRAPAYIRV